MKNEQQSQNLLLKEDPRLNLAKTFFNPQQMFLLRDKLITQGEKRETSTKTCNETILCNKLREFCISYFAALRDKLCWDVSYTVGIPKQRTLTIPARLSFVLKVPRRSLHSSIIYSVPRDRILQRTYYTPVYNMSPNTKWIMGHGNEAY